MQIKDFISIESKGELVDGENYLIIMDGEHADNTGFYTYNASEETFIKVEFKHRGRKRKYPITLGINTCIPLRIYKVIVD